MNVLDTFPDVHETGYRVQADRSAGERALGRIAAISTREYVWTYTDTYNIWEHHEVDHSVGYEYRGSKLIDQQHSAVIPGELTYPVHPESSMYHNHPPVPSNFKHGEIKAQLPSASDIETSVHLIVNGYQDFRIATALGITILTLDPSVIEKGSLHIKGFDVKKRRLRSWEKDFGIVGAIHQATNLFTERFDGQMYVEFKPFVNLED